MTAGRAKGGSSSGNPRRSRTFGFLTGNKERPGEQLLAPLYSRRQTFAVGGRQFHLHPLPAIADRTAHIGPAEPIGFVLLQVPARTRRPAFGDIALLDCHRHLATWPRRCINHQCRSEVPARYLPLPPPSNTAHPRRFRTGRGTSRTACRGRNP